MISNSGTPGFVSDQCLQQFYFSIEPTNQRISWALISSRHSVLVGKEFISIKDYIAEVRAPVYMYSCLN